MDLSWCIMCDCYCTEESLYCSDSCRAKDTNNDPMVLLDSPPTSPCLEPFLSYFHHDRRIYIMTKPVYTCHPLSSIPKYKL
ncbi:hypothetical protein BY458DRAFT_501313 [Sporodiniella umbellata]|nr:hypothetical protein BY458DRAFT_501313 [Sporodiniella umbellata]